MGDPISATASVIAVLQLSSQIISSAYNYLGTVKEAKNDIEMIQSQLRSFDSTLLRLKAAVDEEKLSFDAVQSCDLTQVRTVMEKIYQKLDGTVGGWKNLGRQLVWPLREKDVAKLMMVLNQYRSIVNLALGVDHA